MRAFKIILYSIIFVMIVSSCHPEVSKPQHPSPMEFGWRSVYKHDGNGKLLEGSMDSLIAGIRNGYDVRIGWGWQRQLGDSLLTLEHVAEPLYISIIQGSDVSAIIDPHPLLKSYIAINEQAFSEEGHIWQCIMTTKGTFNAQVYDRSTGKLVKDWPQNHKMTWFLEYPQNTRTHSNPLYE